MELDSTMARRINYVRSVRVLSSFSESIKRGADGGYEMSVPWIPGSFFSSTDGQLSKKRLIRVEEKLNPNPKLSTRKLCEIS